MSSNENTGATSRWLRRIADMRVVYAQAPLRIRGCDCLNESNRRFGAAQYGCGF